jgi:hypothetical protein
MADYITEGYKLCRCKTCGHLCSITFQTTIFTCESCGSTCVSRFHGTVIDKNGDRVY